jgi:hypothetical protein
MRITRREHTMKRIATLGAIITAFAVAPSVAAAGNSTAYKPQFKVQVVTVQLATVQRAQVAYSVQRHQVAVFHAQRYVLLNRALNS